MFEAEGVACGPKLFKYLLTCDSADNIDFNPSSKAAKTAFHGTVVALTQQPCISNSGIERYCDAYMSRSSVKRAEVSKLQLAITITRMKDYKVKKHDLTAPKIAGPSLLRRSDVTTSTYETIASSDDTHTSMPVTSIPTPVWLAVILISK